MPEALEMDSPIDGSNTACGTCSTEGGVLAQNASDTMLELLGYKAAGLGLVNGRSPR